MIRSAYYKGPHSKGEDHKHATHDSKKSRSLSYERTLMVGRYRDELRCHARQVSMSNKIATPPSKRRQFCPYVCADGISVKHRIKRFFGEDYIFLAMLGFIMAFCSFLMDFCIEKIQEIHLWLYEEAARTGPIVQYLAWVGYTLVLVLFSTGFVQSLAPQAIGSGIPEMKTIMRGVILKEYLNFRTLICKMVGLTVSLGSGLPIGKEGPFVHIASVVASVMSKLVTGEDGIFANESRSTEMLAAACAVGVACTFGAPVGGVLFSIEVTSVYFAVRNYWRGFFAAACSATVFRLLAVWFKGEVTVVAFSRTSFPGEAFLPEELIAFALIGVVCGFGGALFIYTHRSIVLFIRNNKVVKKMLEKNRFLYPGIMALFISTMTFPLGYGQFVAGELNFRGAITHMFSNFSWNSPDLNVIEADMVRHWTQACPLYLTLTLYCLNIFFLSAIANTMPIPAGVFIPVFVIGASFGRLFGECMWQWFPNGLRDGSALIYPGGYAVVGAAAFCGSVTHTVSVSVIIFELTGQLVYLLPVMIAVLISNAICAYLQPSIYDSIIRIKHLPYIPDILPTSSGVHRIFVEDLMVRDVKFMSKESTFKDVQDILIEMPRLKAFPLVDKPESMILLGSIPRGKLSHLLEEQVGAKTRKHVAFNRHQLLYNNLGPNSPMDGFGEGNASASHSNQQPRFMVTKVDEVHPNSNPPSSPPESRLGIPAQWRDVSGSHKHSMASHKHSMPSPSSSPVLHQLSVNKKFSLANLSQRMKNNSGGSERSLNTPSASNSTWHHHFSSALHTLTNRIKYFRNRTEDSGNPEDYDLPPDERKVWETERLSQSLDFELVHIDPAPFQLVERTSLYKVHSLFSLLGLNRAYVTAFGKLIGVVALKELRLALESAQHSFIPNETNSNERLDHDEEDGELLNEDNQTDGPSPESVELKGDLWNDSTAQDTYKDTLNSVPKILPDIKIDGGSASESSSVAEHSC